MAGEERIVENTLVRSQPCAECGETMLWTQNAWHAGGAHAAAYQCPNGHVVDPAWTRQCPVCGVHDTAPTGEDDGRQQFKCLRCGGSFTFPR
jgi:transposase